MPDKGYRDSFRNLGYDIGSHRQLWSAANETGVCLSLWKDEIDTTGAVLFIDTRRHCGPLEIWKDKVGAKRRLEHLKIAWEQHDRWVDMVIRQGGPSDENVPTNPWPVKASKLKGKIVPPHKWRLQTFEADTGHFSAKIEEFPQE